MFSELILNPDLLNTLRGDLDLTSPPGLDEPALRTPLTRWFIVVPGDPYACAVLARSASWICISLNLLLAA